MAVDRAYANKRISFQTFGVIQVTGKLLASELRPFSIGKGWSSQYLSLDYSMFVGHFDTLTLTYEGTITGRLSTQAGMR